ncbi:Tyrosinase [Colletotrichum orbiculare MAFF 240422]|uniref:tyrosinase n=1 Tax=Colletotrichum orbiculare (strain 104-T / ATCC 96160 / CBS 514.97 / LARS 414 / MAFF 240422) TaxID=1213857 RepID=N4VXH0_COLOR|nr:Tyrosinase [Colletotrichum orbiculare MAFF 240422]
MTSPFTSYPITGIPNGGSNPPARQEINAWATNNPIQLSLFVQALRIFQSMDFKDQLSYYRIAGIHGLPATSWDNDPIPYEASQTYPSAASHQDGTPDFYCPHNTLIFPTWHRAYLSLYEQRLWEIMTKQIVPNITTAAKEQWMDEANKWRVPYWDWAGIPSVPAVCTTPTIRINLPDGSTSDDWNPLYQFSTSNLSTSQPSSKPLFKDQATFGEFAIFSEDSASLTNQTYATSRWGINHPILPQQASGVVNNQLVDQALQHPPYTLVGNAGGLSGSLAEQVARLFQKGSFTNFAQFATTTHGDQGPSGYLSLELLHNCIHDFTGGVGYVPDPSANQKPPPNIDPKSPPPKYAYGHMTDLGVAAFDPIFWLHHCNVDRQLAIFQQLNYVAWWSGRDPDYDPASDAPLYPFHTDTKFDHFTSDLVQDWTKLGYTYDTLQSSPGSNSPAVSAADLKKRLTLTYGALKKAVQAVPADGLDGLDNDFIINVVYNRYALGGRSYIIYFFIGKPAEEGSQGDLWNPDYVGSIHSFSRNWGKSGVSCENCARQQDNKLLSKGQVPVTLQLLQRAVSDDERWNGVKHLGADHILEYVKENLYWKVVALPGENIELKSFPDLKVSFLAGKATHSDDPEEASKYHGYDNEWEVTGRKNGSKHWDHIKKDGKTVSPV